jgi:hypothetical protein
MPLIHDITNDIKNDLKTARKVWLPWWGVMCWMGASGLIIGLLLALGRFDLALPTLSCVGTVLFTIICEWKLRRHLWFWITMSSIAALHVPLILFVPWTTKWVPALAVAAISSLDFCVMLTILSVVRKFMEGTKRRHADGVGN